MAAYKENVADIRESHVRGIVEGLSEFGVEVYGYDPLLGNNQTCITSFNSQARQTNPILPPDFMYPPVVIKPLIMFNTLKKILPRPSLQGILLPPQLPHLRIHRLLLLDAGCAPLLLRGRRVSDCIQQSLNIYLAQRMQNDIHENP